MDREDPRYRKAVQQVRADPSSRYCFVTGRPIEEGAGDPHHVLPVSLYPELAYEGNNIVIVHRRPHNVLTDGDPEQMASLPRIQNLLARMRSLDRNYYEQFKAKLQPWMTLHNGWDW
jgi:hypothetical protein